LVILRDSVPANTSFDSVVGTPDARALVLYHRTGDALHSYSSTPQSPVDALAWGLSSFEVGTTLRAAFAARINANASAPIDNTATMYWRGQNAQSGTNFDFSTPSNPVEVGVPLAPPTLFFYTDSTYSREAKVTGMGQNLWLQGDASACNGDPLLAEHATISLRSDKTGDTLEVPATETGPNTGLFRADKPVPTAGGVAVAGDGILQIAANDQLIATLGGCGTTSATAQIWADPTSIVFNSRTGEPIPGAHIWLVDASTGQSALSSKLQKTTTSAVAAVAPVEPVWSV